MQFKQAPHPQSQACTHTHPHACITYKCNLTRTSNIFTFCCFFCFHICLTPHPHMPVRNSSRTHFELRRPLRVAYFPAGTHKHTHTHTHGRVRTRTHTHAHTRTSEAITWLFLKEPNRTNKHTHTQPHRPSTRCTSS